MLLPILPKYNSRYRPGSEERHYGLHNSRPANLYERKQPISGLESWWWIWKCQRQSFDRKRRYHSAKKSSSRALGPSLTSDLESPPTHRWAGFHGCRGFWLGSQNARRFGVDARDVQLHEIFLVGLNLGLRFDEVSKLKVKHISLNSRTVLDCWRLTILLFEKRIRIRQRNETTPSARVAWKYNTASLTLYGSSCRGAFLAGLSRKQYRTCVFYIKLTKSGSVLDKTKPFNSKTFSEFFPSRIEKIGVGRGDVVMRYGYSIKRGAARICRSLNLRDEQIMELIQMKGPHANAN